MATAGAADDREGDKEEREESLGGMAQADERAAH